MDVNSISSLPSIDSMPASKSLPVLIEPQTEMPGYFRRKALATRALGAVLLVLAFPIILLLMALVCLTSAGPGLYRQRRVGRGGRDFTIFKLRTMYRDAEAATGPTWCRPSDSRITCVGRLLRFLHLDELPQLINIARGEMDLIGPRPERPEFVEKLVNEIHGYAERLAILPGVTGLAQINLPPDETIDCVRRKLVLDLEYIQTATFGLDMRILLCTAIRMIGIRHGRAVRLFKLERPYPQLDKYHPMERALAEQPTQRLSRLVNGHTTQSRNFANNRSPLNVVGAVVPTEPKVDTIATDDDPISVAPRNPK